MDRASWRLDPQGVFSVKVLRNLLEEKTPLGVGGKRRNNHLAKINPEKDLHFCVVLDKIGIDLDSTLCPRCECEVETANHALFKCEKVKNLWQLVGRCWMIDLTYFNSFDGLTEKKEINEVT